MRGARGNSEARNAALVVCSDKASAGLTRPDGSRSNTRTSPTVENTMFLWPMAPSWPSSSIACIALSRLCAGSPMPMNTTFCTGRSLRASATWATISALPSWRCKPSRPVMQKTQPTAQPTCVDTHTPAAGQQHALDRLAVGQPDQQARRAVRGRVLGAQPRQPGQLIDERRQFAAQRLRQVMLDPPPSAVLRPGLRPTAQHMGLMPGAGAQALQALADLLDAHRCGAVVRRAASALSPGSGAGPVRSTRRETYGWAIAISSRARCLADLPRSWATPYSVTT